LIPERRQTRKPSKRGRRRVERSRQPPRTVAIDVLCDIAAEVIRPASTHQGARRFVDAHLLFYGLNRFAIRLQQTPTSSISARAITADPECKMEELNGRMLACQILITGLIARVANERPDPLRFLSDFRDEIKAVVKGVNIAGMDNTDRVRQFALASVDELFSLMKPPSTD
jgi:hypothetical protein